MSGATAAAPLARNGDAPAVSGGGLRIGVDVGGTFTKAVAIEPVRSRSGRGGRPDQPRARPRRQRRRRGALAQLLDTLGERAASVELVAFSTTQAMNALLEGDVPRVGVIGLGSKPDLRRRASAEGRRVGLAPGRDLETEHEFLDPTRPRRGAARAASSSLRPRAAAVAVSGAFAVEAPEHELLVADIAAEAGMPACCGHQLSGAYGLETRTVSATINAAILPASSAPPGWWSGRWRSRASTCRCSSSAATPARWTSRRSAAVPRSRSDRARRRSRRRPPPVGVADAVVVEVGGTSTNVSVVSAAGRCCARSR